ncbi:helix-turn-helix domain-containing protein [Achromobacter xylosoxidans]|nr:helix-turn-helix domain-containing protein [Achromobacter xylosoxidans]MDD5001943.1 helix-turn-helix domain-containing protein [Thiomonas arsenitoxydans]
MALRTAGHSIPETARLAGCSESQVKRVWAMSQEQSHTSAKTVPR